MTLSVAVTGLRATVAGLTVAVAGVATRAAVGLEAGGRAVRDKARANIGRRHYRGRAERETTVSRPSVTPQRVDVTVGIHAGDYAPEGRTFEFGWHSRTGKQPPIAPLAAWAVRRGLAKTDSEARQVAFVVARNMKARGYSFGELHWLDDAAKSEAPVVLAEVARFIGT